jgi:hypothetical protein
MQIVHKDYYVCMIPDTPDECNQLKKWCRQHFGRSHGVNSPWWIVNSNPHKIFVSKHKSHQTAVIELMLTWA